MITSAGAARIGVFLAVLAVVFAAAFGVGRAAGPAADDPPPAPGHQPHPGHG